MNRLKTFLFILICTTVCNAQNPRYSSFIKSFTSSFTKDSRFRSNDSLFYISEVMNFADEHLLDGLSIEYLREHMFDLLDKETPCLIYSMGIDIERERIYRCVNYDYNWFRYRGKRKKKRIVLSEIKLSHCHPNVTKKLTILINYIDENRPEFVFKIYNIMDLNNSFCTELYWIIKNGEIRVLRIIDSNTYEVFDAYDYLTNRATEDVLSPKLRWMQLISDY